MRQTIHYVRLMERRIAPITKVPNGKLEDVSIYFNKETGQYIVSTEYEGRIYHIIISGRSDKNYIPYLPDDIGKYGTPERKEYMWAKNIIHVLDIIGDRIAFCLRRIAKSLGRGVNKDIIKPISFVDGSTYYRYFTDVLHLSVVAYALYRVSLAIEHHNLEEISLPFIGDKDDCYLYLGTIAETKGVPGGTTEDWIISQGYEKIDVKSLWDIG